MSFLTFEEYLRQQQLMGGGGQPAPAAPPMPIPGSTYQPAPQFTPPPQFTPAPQFVNQPRYIPQNQPQAQSGPPPQPQYIPTAQPPMQPQVQPSPSPQPQVPPQQPMGMYRTADPYGQPTPEYQHFNAQQSPIGIYPNDDPYTRPVDPGPPPQPQYIATGTPQTLGELPPASADYSRPSPNVDYPGQEGEPQQAIIRALSPQELGALSFEREIDEVIKSDKTGFIAGAALGAGGASLGNVDALMPMTREEAMQIVLDEKAKQRAKDDAEAEVYKQQLKQQQDAVAIENAEVSSGNMSLPEIQKKNDISQEKFQTPYVFLDPTRKEMVDSAYSQGGMLDDLGSNVRDVMTKSKNAVGDVVGPALYDVFGKYYDDVPDPSETTDQIAQRRFGVKFNLLDQDQQALVGREYVVQQKVMEMQGDAAWKSMTPEQREALINKELITLGILDENGNPNPDSAMYRIESNASPAEAQRNFNLFELGKKALGGHGIDIKLQRDENGSYIVPLYQEGYWTALWESEKPPLTLIAVNRANDLITLSNGAPAFKPEGFRLPAEIGRAQGDMLTGNAFDDYLLTPEGQNALLRSFNYNEGTADFNVLYDSWLSGSGFWKGMAKASAYDFQLGLYAIGAVGATTTIKGMRAAAYARFANAEEGSNAWKMLRALDWGVENNATINEIIDIATDPLGNAVFRTAGKTVKPVKELILGKSTQQQAKETVNTQLENADMYLSERSKSPNAPDFNLREGGLPGYDPDDPSSGPGGPMPEDPTDPTGGGGGGGAVAPDAAAISPPTPGAEPDAAAGPVPTPPGGAPSSPDVDGAIPSRPLSAAEREQELVDGRISELTRLLNSMLGTAREGGDEFNSVIEELQVLGERSVDVARRIDDELADEARRVDNNVGELTAESVSPPRTEDGPAAVESPILETDGTPRVRDGSTPDGGSPEIDDTVISDIDGPPSSAVPDDTPPSSPAVPASAAPGPDVPRTKDTNMPISGSLSNKVDVRRRAISGDPSYRFTKQAAMDRQTLFDSPKNGGWSVYPNGPDRWSRYVNDASAARRTSPEYENFINDHAEMIARNPQRVDLLRELYDSGMFYAGMNKYSTPLRDILSKATELAKKYNTGTIPPMYRDLTKGQHPKVKRFLVGKPGDYIELHSGDMIGVDLEHDKNVVQMQFVGFHNLPDLTQNNLISSWKPGAKNKKAAPLVVRDANGVDHVVHWDNLVPDRTKHTTHVPGLHAEGSSRLLTSDTPLIEKTGDAPPRVQTIEDTSTTSVPGSTAPEETQNNFSDAADDFDDDYNNILDEDMMSDMDDVRKGVRSPASSDGPAIEGVESLMRAANAMRVAEPNDRRFTSGFYRALEDSITELWVKLKSGDGDPVNITNESVNKIKNIITGQMRREGKNRADLINLQIKTNELLKAVDSESAAPNPIDNLGSAKPARVANKPRGAHVVNLKETGDYDVYIGRNLPHRSDLKPTGWENNVGVKGGNYERTQAFADWLAGDSEQAQIMFNRLDELRGKRLGCWCYPNTCHGDVLSMLADMAPAQREAWRSLSRENMNRAPDFLPTPGIKTKSRHAIMPEEMGTSRLMLGQSLLRQGTERPSINNELLKPYRDAPENVEYLFTDGRRYQVSKNASNRFVVTDKKTGGSVIEGTKQQVEDYLRGSRAVPPGNPLYRGTQRPTWMGQVNIDNTLSGFQLFQAFRWLKIPIKASRTRIMEKKALLSGIRWEYGNRVMFEDILEMGVDPEELLQNEGLDWWLKNTNGMEFHSPFFDDVTERGLDLDVKGSEITGMSFNPTQYELADPGQRHVTFTATDPKTGNSYSLTIDHGLTPKEQLATKAGDKPMRFVRMRGAGRVEQHFVVDTHYAKMVDADGNPVINPYTGFAQSDLTKPVYAVYSGEQTASARYLADMTPEQRSQIKPLLVITKEEMKGQDPQTFIKNVLQNRAKEEQQKTWSTRYQHPAGDKLAYFRELHPTLFKNTLRMSEDNPLVQEQLLRTHSVPEWWQARAMRNNYPREFADKVNTKMIAEGIDPNDTAAIKEIQSEISMAMFRALPYEARQEINALYGRNDPSISAQAMWKAFSLERVKEYTYVVDEQRVRRIAPNDTASKPMSREDIDFRALEAKLEELKEANLPVDVMLRQIEQAKTLHNKYMSALTDDLLKHLANNNKVEYEEMIDLMILDDEFVVVDVAGYQGKQIDMIKGEDVQSQTDWAALKSDGFFGSAPGVSIKDQRFGTNLGEKKITIRWKKKPSEMGRNLLGDAYFTNRNEAEKAAKALQREQASLGGTLENGGIDGYVIVKSGVNSSKKNTTATYRVMSDPVLFNGKRFSSMEEAAAAVQGANINKRDVNFQRVSEQTNEFGETTQGGWIVEDRRNNARGVAETYDTVEEAREAVEKAGYSWDDVEQGNGQYALYDKVSQRFVTSRKYADDGVAYTMEKRVFGSFKDMIKYVRSNKNSNIQVWDPEKASLKASAQEFNAIGETTYSGPVQRNRMIRRKENAKSTFDQETQRLLSRRMELDAARDALRRGDVETAYASLASEQGVDAEGALIAQADEAAAEVDVDTSSLDVGEREAEEARALDAGDVSASDEELAAAREARGVEEIEPTSTAREEVLRENEDEIRTGLGRVDPRLVDIEEKLDKMFADADRKLTNHFKRMGWGSDEKLEAIKLWRTSEGKSLNNIRLENLTRDDTYTKKTRDLLNKADLEQSDVSVRISKNGGNLWYKTGKIFDPTSGKKIANDLYNEAVQEFRTMLDSEGLFKQSANASPAAPEVFKRNGLEIRIHENKDGTFFVKEKNLLNPKKSDFRTVLTNVESPEEAKRMYEQMRGFKMDVEGKSLADRVTNINLSSINTKLDKEGMILGRGVFKVEADESTMLAQVVAHKPTVFKVDRPQLQYKIGEFDNAYEKYYPSDWSVFGIQFFDSASPLPGSFASSVETPGRKIFNGSNIAAEPMASGAFRIVPSDALPGTTIGGTNTTKQFKLMWSDPETVPGLEKIKMHSPWVEVSVYDGTLQDFVNNTNLMKQVLLDAGNFAEQAYVNGKRSALLADPKDFNWKEWLDFLGMTGEVKQNFVDQLESDMSQYAARRASMERRIIAEVQNDLRARFGDAKTGSYNEGIPQAELQGRSINEFMRDLKFNLRTIDVLETYIDPKDAKRIEQISEGFTPSASYVPHQETVPFGSYAPEDYRGSEPVGNAEYYDPYSEGIDDVDHMDRYDGSPVDPEAEYNRRAQSITSPDDPDLGSLMNNLDHTFVEENKVPLPIGSADWGLADRVAYIDWWRKLSDNKQWMYSKLMHFGMNPPRSLWYYQKYNYSGLKYYAPLMSDADKRLMTPLSYDELKQLNPGMTSWHVWTESELNNVEALGRYLKQGGTIEEIADDPEVVKAWRTVNNIEEKQLKPDDLCVNGSCENIAANYAAKKEAAAIIDRFVAERPFIGAEVSSLDNQFDPDAFEMEPDGTMADRGDRVNDYIDDNMNSASIADKIQIATRNSNATGREAAKLTIRQELNAMFGFPERHLSNDAKHTNLSNAVWYRANGSSSPLAFSDVDGVAAWRYLQSIASIARYGKTLDELSVLGPAAKLMIDALDEDVAAVAGLNKLDFSLLHSWASANVDELDAVADELVQMAKKYGLPEETSISLQQTMPNNSRGNLSMAKNSSRMPASMAGKTFDQLTPDEQALTKFRLLNTILIGISPSSFDPKLVKRTFLHELMHTLVQIGAFSKQEYKALLDYTKRMKVSPGNRRALEPEFVRQVEDLIPTVLGKPKGTKITDLTYYELASIQYQARVKKLNMDDTNSDLYIGNEALSSLWEDFATDRQYFDLPSSRKITSIMDRLRAIFDEARNIIARRPNGKQILTQLDEGRAQDVLLRPGYRPEGSRGLFTDPLTDAQRANTQDWRVAENIQFDPGAKKSGPATMTDSPVLADLGKIADEGDMITKDSRLNPSLASPMPIQALRNKEQQSLARRLIDEFRITGTRKAVEPVRKAARSSDAPSGDYHTIRVKSVSEDMWGIVLTEEEYQILRTPIKYKSGKDTKTAPLGRRAEFYYDSIEKLHVLQKKRQMLEDRGLKMHGSEFKEMMNLERSLQSTASRKQGFKPFMRTEDMTLNQRRRIALKRLEEELEMNYGLRDESGVLTSEGRTILGKFLDNYIDIRRTTALYNVATGPAYVMMNAVGNAFTLALTNPTAFVHYMSPVFDPNSDFWRSVKEYGVRGAVGDMSERIDKGFVPRVELERSALGLGQTKDLVHTNRDAITQGGTPFQRMQDSKQAWKRVVGTAGNVVAPAAFRDFAAVFDIHIRESIWKTQMDKQLIGSRRAIMNQARNALINTQRKHGIAIPISEGELQDAFDELFEQSGGYFSGTDLYQKLKQLGGGIDVVDNWADRIGRDWKYAVRVMDTKARKEVDRIAFSFKPTKADEVASKFFMFHYWASRQTYLYITEAAKKPYLLSAYSRMLNLMELEAEENNYPDRVKNYLKLMNSPFGFVTFFSPQSLLTTWATFAPWQDNKEDFRNLTLLGKLKTDSPLMLLPIWNDALAMTGVFGPDYPTTDLVGLDPVIKSVVNIMNGINAYTYEKNGEGVFQKMGIGVDENGNRVLIDTPTLQRIARAGYQKIQDFAPGNAKLSDLPSVADLTNKTMFNVAVQLYMQENGLDIANPADLELAIDQVALDFSESGEYYQKALTQISYQGVFDTALKETGFPFRTTSVPQIEIDAKRVQNQYDELGMDGGPVEQLGQASNASANTQMMDNAREIDGWYDVGSESNRKLKLAYEEFKRTGDGYSVALEGGNILYQGKMGTATFGKEESDGWSALDDNEKRQAAQNWMANTYGPQAMDRVYEQYKLEAEYLKAHPMVAGYKGLKEMYEEAEDKEQFLKVLYEENPDFADWVDHERENPLTTFDEYGVPRAFSWDGYLALMGKSNSMWGQQPDAQLSSVKVAGLKLGETPADFYYAKEAERDAEYSGGAGKARVMGELAQVAELKSTIMGLDPSGALWNAYLGKLAKTSNPRFDDIVPGSYDIITAFKIGNSEKAYWQPTGWTKQYLLDTMKLQQQGIDIDFDTWYSGQIARFAADQETKTPEELAKQEAEMKAKTATATATAPNAVAPEGFDPNSLIPNANKPSNVSNYGKIVRVTDRISGMDATSNAKVSVPPTIDLVVVSEKMVEGNKYVQVYMPVAQMTVWVPAKDLRVMDRAAAAD